MLEITAPCGERVNEGSTAWLTARFRNRAGQLDTPSAVSYSVWCVTNAQEIRALTSVTAAAELELELTPADNRIVSTSNRRELRRVTVWAAFGAGQAHNDQFDYWVHNLTRVTS